MSRFVGVLLPVSVQISAKFFRWFPSQRSCFYLALLRRLSMRRSSERKGNLSLLDTEVVILQINACGLSSTVVVISHTVRRPFPVLVGEIGWSQDCHSYASSVPSTVAVKWLGLTDRSFDLPTRTTRCWCTPIEGLNHRRVPQGAGAHR